MIRKNELLNFELAGKIIYNLLGGFEDENNISDENKMLSKSIENLKFFKICEKDDYIRSWKLDDTLIINKFVCRDKKAKFDQFNISYGYDFETGYYNFNVILKENYKDNITTIQTVAIFRELAEFHFDFRSSISDSLIRSIHNGVILALIKFGYTLDKFTLDEFFKSQAVVNPQDIDSGILKLISDKDKMNEVSYEALFNLAQGLGLEHYKPEVDECISNLILPDIQIIELP